MSLLLPWVCKWEKNFAHSPFTDGPYSWKNKNGSEHLSQMFPVLILMVIIDIVYKKNALHLEQKKKVN